MFEGVAPPSSSAAAAAAAADQFHKFSSTANQSSSSSPHLPLHLSFTSSSSTTTTPPIFPISFDPYHHHHHQVLQPAAAPSILLQPNFFHPLNYNPHTPANARSIIKNIHHHQDKQLVEQASPTIQQDSPWSNEEVLSLLRIRSSMELNWFPSPEFTWEHVSRKLSEVGFKRSAEKCRDKFEEESRYINTINNNTSNSNHNYQRGFSSHHDDELVNHLHNHADVSHPQLYHSNDDNANNKTNHEDDGDGSEHLAKQAQERKDKIDDVDDADDDDDDPDHTADTGDDNDHDDDDYGHKQDPMNQFQNPSSSSNGNTTTSKSISNNGDKKRKRSEEDKFEMFKGFCQDIVDKMMAQQEEMQNKLIEDMIKRDQEKLAREDAWKKQELDRINHDLQLRSDQQSLAGDRQSSILKFLQNFPTANPRQLLDHYHQKVPIMISNNNNGIGYPVPTSSSSSSAASQPNPKNTESESQEAGLRAEIRNETRPIQSEFKSVQKDGNRNSDSNPPHKSCGGGELENSQREEVGKRWPRDEVLALINLRCGIYNNNNGGGVGGGGGRNDVAVEKEGGSSSAPTNKAPLWERISRGMLELGYKRSAKRCKEKWENINKYFRKTKDLNKKRSLDSRTCPYFHQLNSLYGGNGATAAAEDAGTMPEILP